MKLTRAQITDLMSNMGGVFFSDYQIYKSDPGARHLRGGKITRGDSKEGRGVRVHALAHDELGNCSALCSDGRFRLYY